MKIEDVLATHIAITTAEDLEAYVTSGRMFADLTDVHLLSQWTAATKAYFQNPACPAATVLQADLSGELQLRGIEKPWNDVPEFSAARARASAKLHQFEDDPEALALASEDLAERLQTTLDKIKKSSKH